MEVAKNFATVAINYETVKERIVASRAFIEQKVANNEIVYGVTTGFGPLVNTKIEPKDAILLQKNLLISHATGVGKPLSTTIVRAIMLIRLNTFLQGYSGVRIELIEHLLNFINLQVHPVIPSQGSVGASGDLCPLSHLGSSLIGYGKVEYKGEIVSADSNKLPTKPIELSYKEGLAINNGTTLMAALGVEAVYRAKKLIERATQSTCLVYEALGARKQSFHPAIHRLRRHTAQQTINQNILTNTEGSAIFLTFAVGKAKPQDSYSLRCVPQVFGASLHAVNHAKEVIENELNAVVDNPIILANEDIAVSGGNFHGQPVALVLDYLKLAIAEIGSILERQITKLVDNHHNYGLPAFLIDGVGLNSGLMITQYVAAGLVSENKVLVHPASADSIPTSNNQEDHVSMGPIGGRQALEIMDNVEQILAIHYMCAAQAYDLRKLQFNKLNLSFPKPSASSEALYGQIRKVVNYLEQDLFIHDELNKLSEWLKD
ncbi:UNVERIFIED_CONTAM: hypothetical protein GTU68_043457 [Idotea baltica]|nr:hypothetical protein [Idotea baltica]